jgi:hypothetical protein
MIKYSKLGLLASVAFVLAGPATAADPATIDWSKIEPSSVTLFYPGQSSYEWVTSAAHTKGGARVTEGAACITCHQGDEMEMGKKLVQKGPLEPTPVAGKMPTVDLKVQVAYDTANAYFRMQWKTQNPAPGTEHQYLRYDGHSWKVYGYPRLDKPVQDGKEAAIYEDRMTLMIDDGKVRRFAQQGCWLTCHNGERDMPGVATRAEVDANPLLSAIKKTDVRKYLPATRTDPRDWKTGKTVEEIAALKASGQFVDLIQWRAHRTYPLGLADDGYVLEYRNGDAGRDPFGGNADDATHQPKFMWDASKVGYRSITADQLGKAPHFLIKETNAVPFDAKAAWKEGDMVPDYVLSAKDASGSAADNKAIASWKDGMWTVVIIRPLGLTNPDDKTLKDGGLYNVGFAVHDDNITTRGHHVSFVRSVGFGVAADIKAVKLP